MNKDAGLNIPGGIDMEIVPSTGNASANIFAVILKINNKQGFARFAVSHSLDPIIHILPLGWCRDKLFNRFLPDGHIVEIPRKFDPAFNHQVNKFLAGNRVNIFPCVADGNAKKALIPF
jgi:hypothetical protein